MTWLSERTFFRGKGEQILKRETKNAGGKARKIEER